MMSVPNDRRMLGGADLECSLAFEKMTIDNFVLVVRRLLEVGLSRVDEKPFFVADDEYCEFEDSVNVSTIESLDGFLRQHRCGVAIANFKVTLNDVETRLSLAWHVHHNVVVISVPEDMLWAFSNDLKLAKFERLRAFGDVCKTVSDLIPPRFAIIDTEGVSPEEFTVSTAEESTDCEAYNEDTLSEETLRRIFDWYLNEYAARWDNATDIS